MGGGPGRALVSLDKPSVRVRYELEELGEPTLRDVLERFLETSGVRAAAGTYA
jgi:predicted GTPase